MQGIQDRMLWEKTNDIYHDYCLVVDVESVDTNIRSDNESLSSTDK